MLKYHIIGLLGCSAIVFTLGISFINVVEIDNSIGDLISVGVVLASIFHTTYSLGALTGRKVSQLKNRR